MDEYLMRHHCDVLSQCIGSLLSTEYYPDNVIKLANELMAACDEYVSDGYSMRVDVYDNKEMDYIFLPANTDRTNRISG